MKEIKIQPSLGYSKMREAERLQSMARTMVSLTAAGAAFGAMLPKLAQLQSALDAYKTAYGAWIRGDKASTLTKNNAGAVCETLFGQAAQSCAAIAGTNVTLFLSSGFDLKKAPEPVTFMGVPQDMKIEYGNQSGQLLVRFRTVRGGRSYQLYMGTAPDAMTLKNTFSGSRLFVDGLQAGTTYYFKVRAIGPRDLVGDASQTVSIMAV